MSVEPAPAEATPQPQRGGSVRLAVSGAEREALARRALHANGAPEATFAIDRLDRWSRRASATLLDHVEFVSQERIGPAELLSLGEADLAVVYGRQVSRIRAAQRAEHRLLRATGWDRTYAIRFDDQARWTNDPNFRRWWAETVDRDDLIAQLFEGQGEPAWTLLQPAREPRWAPPLRRPFGPTSRPVLSVGFDPADREARAIAARMKATFALHGVDLLLVEGKQRQRPELTLVAQQRRSDDPVAALEPLLTAGADDARVYLEQAAAARGESRTALAELAEDALLIEARIVPLVRLDAWIALSSDLRGVEPGWTGELGLENTWWER